MKNNRGITNLGYYPKNIDVSSYVWFLDNNPIYFLKESVHPPEFNTDLKVLPSGIVELNSKEYNFEQVTAVYNDTFVEMTYNDTLCRYLNGNSNFVIQYSSRIPDKFFDNSLDNWGCKITLPVDFNIYVYRIDDIKLAGVLETKHNFGDKIVPNHRFDLKFEGEYFIYTLARIDNVYYHCSGNSVEGKAVQRVDRRGVCDPFLVIYSGERKFGELKLFTKFNYEVSGSVVKLELPPKNT